MTTETNPLDCPECRGAGEITIAHPSGDPQCETPVTCGACRGTGDAVTPINQSDEE